MSRPVRVLRGAVTAIREQLLGFTRQSERTLLLGTVLLASAVSAAIGFVLIQYYANDVLSSLTHFPQDCPPELDWGITVGRWHCFSDYAWQVTYMTQPNPWARFGDTWPTPYPPAAMAPCLIFGLLGKWLGAPQPALFGYLFVLTIAVITPAVWAARGARGLERVVVFLACGVAAIPAWMAIDRGNAVGFMVPAALVFLVALCRRRWGLVTIMVVLAALVKPQFIVLAVALFAARQWRLGGIAVAGAVIPNLAGYAFWPRAFPQTLMQTIRNNLHLGSFDDHISYGNASFGRGILWIPDAIKARETGGTIPDGFLAGPRSLIGYLVLFLVVVCVLALGRRIPPVMAGIVLLATASLFPVVAWRYYLVFVLPVAALVARDPDGAAGTGIFDRLATVGGRRRAVGICVSLAAALTIAQIPLPHPPIGMVSSSSVLVETTAEVTPLLWLIACAAIIVSYVRRPHEPTSRTDFLEPATPPRPANHALNA